MAFEKKSAGRPTDEDRKKEIVDEYGRPLYDVFSAECGKPAEKLTKSEFEGLVANLRRERGVNYRYMLQLRNKS